MNIYAIIGPRSMVYYPFGINNLYAIPSYLVAPVGVITGFGGYFTGLLRFFRFEQVLIQFPAHL